MPHLPRADIALPVLYRTMNLRLRHLGDHHIKNLTSRNLGLRSTRILNIHDDTQEYLHWGHGKSLIKLISAFPLNSLQRFNLDTLAEVPTELTTLLHTKQQLLQNCTLHRQSKCTRVDYMGPLAALQNLTSVRLLMCTRADCEQGALVLQHTSQLRELSIRSYMTPTTKESLEDWETLTILLRQWDESTCSNIRVSKLKLRRLFIAGMHLPGSASKLLSAIDISTLRDVAFFVCGAMEEFLVAFKRARVDLRSFEDDCRLDAQELFARSLNGLITSLGGLQDLKITQGVRRSDLFRCSWTAMSHLGSTLRTLYIDDDGGGSDPFLGEGRHIEDFRKLCVRCHKLEQLALEIGELSRLPRLRSLDRTSDVLDCIRHLDKLAALRLFTYPRYLDRAVADDFVETPLSEAATAGIKLVGQMQDLADDVFTQTHETCTELRALQIDARTAEQDCNCRDEAHKFAYVRGYRVNAFNQSKVAALPIDPPMLRHHEPCSKIFYDRKDESLG